MVGEYDNYNIRGIIPRSFEYLFNKIESIENEDKSTIFEISIAFIQIYLEKIEDLLEKKNNIKIREDPETGVFLDNCCWIQISNSNEAKNVFKNGKINKKKKKTNMNEKSSRSHAILIIKIEKLLKEKNNKIHLMTKGLLNLVDLAGSERVYKSKLTDSRLGEAKNINKSLLALGNCIQKLSNKSNNPNKPEHIPYRDSKLTRILQDSLGGNAKTSLIVTISPSNYNAEESLSSLNFGSRAMKVKNKPKININNDYNNDIILLQEEYAKLQQKYLELKNKYEIVCEENEKLKNGQFLGKPTGYEKELEIYKNKFRELEEKYNAIYKRKEEDKEIEVEKIDKLISEQTEKIDILTEELNMLKNENLKLNKKNNKLNIEYDNLKKINEDILLEKEELNNKIILLNELNKENTFLLEEKTKELLAKHNIDKNSVNNQNINLILNKLINDIEQKTKEDNIHKDQINILNNYLDETKKNYQERMKLIEIEKNKEYEDKIKKMELENAKLQDIKNYYIEQINDKEKEYNELYNNNTNYKNKFKKMKDEKSKLENSILILNENNKKLNEQILELKNESQKTENEYLTKIKTLENNQSNLEKMKSDYESQILTIKNDKKYSNINAYLNGSELKRLNNTIDINEKLLNKVTNLKLNYMNIFNIFKKEFKNMEIILENVNFSLTSETYGKTMKRAKEQINKIQSMIENFRAINNNNNTIYKNYNIKDNINKLNDLTEENREYMINIFIILYKLYNKVIELYKENKKKEFFNDNKSLVNNTDKNEEKMKYDIIDIIMKNIDEFKPICYNTDNSDLKEELNLLKKNCNKLNILEVLQN